MYIIFKKDSKKVFQILGKQPVAISSTLEIARCDNIPKYNEAQGEYLTVTNLQEKTEKYIDKEYTEKEIEIDGELQVVTEEIEVEKERKYFTCDLIVSFNYEKYKANKIAELKSKLQKSDYVANKLTEVVANAMSSGDNAKLNEFLLEYSQILNDRQAWRDEINSIENFKK